MGGGGGVPGSNPPSVFVEMAPYNPQGKGKGPGGNGGGGGGGGMHGKPPGIHRFDGEDDGEEEDEEDGQVS